MRGLSDLDPNSARNLLRGALPEWPALILFAPFMAGLIWLTCTL